ncbi:Dam family site-specific DNA-(adenine-N6)-methyltransferase [Morganella morganii]|uniref:DNA adenine methylase n=1 Tax=Morganella morganii TaxID=582 RepID=UPI001BD4E981|nr:Dam family site-specific DNA-(adenine-N6)-methyltransferase [Morganella morganii]MBS9583566.1 Dam family site-specific DNA-(adenine-N6)-methyltransferase [Morganella morganii subsp. morganii]QWL85763.1 Dam family site-specific DNA-(adenine-N6)-methyltransferase [Morganella morganii subsp. morganii]UVZ53957.1 Dam family site-specific DNA-(adenine-N6)-methyltransferase [Morganella morganii]WPU18745.1 Dam family site-specific DNA-(adenine-N6)-methyltransferase [Morganella morganii]HCR3211253.1
MNKTILKWAGSKVGIMEQLRPYLPKTKRLVEPFAGSCAVMMNTDYEQYLIADVNNDLITMYQQIASDNIDEVIRTVSGLFELEAVESGYYIERDFFNKSKHVLQPEYIAAYFIYLNRHCYNGLCRYNKKGGFNVPCGNYKKTYFPEEEIRTFATKAHKADIKCQGWAATLLQTCAGDGIYCDPPYMGTGFTRYHTEGFNDGDQVALAEALQTLHATKGNPVTVSNSLAAKELYADLGFTIHEIEAPRKISANGNREKAPEIIAVLGGC